MIAFLANWKTWLALLIGVGPFALKLLPITAPVFVAFMQSKTFRSLMIGALIAGSALLIVSALEARAYNRGAAEAVRRINEQDRRAVERANEAAIPVEQCHDRGGEWVQERGVCKLP
jgi:hypothetical protein